MKHVTGALDASMKHVTGALGASMKRVTGAFDAGWQILPVDIRHFVRSMRRQVVPLLLMPTVWVIFGFAYMLYSTPMFTSSASLSVDVGSIEGESLDETLETHMESIRSTRVALEVIDRLGVAADPTVNLGFLYQIIGAIRDLLGVDTRDEMSNEEIRALLADQLAASLDVLRVGDSTIIRVSYTSETPRFSAAVANAFAEAYVDSLIKRSLKRTQQRAEFLRSRVEETREQAASSYQEVQRIRSRGTLEPNGSEDLNARATWREEVRNWAELLIAEHQAEVFQNIYAAHLQELEEVYGRAGVVPIQVMAHGLPSAEPSSPNYRLVLVLSAVIGIALGLAIAMLREWQVSRGALSGGNPEKATL